jgi:hypothetical protein
MGTLNPGTLQMDIPARYGFEGPALGVGWAFHQYHGVATTALPRTRPETRAVRSRATATRLTHRAPSYRPSASRAAVREGSPSASI